MKLLNHKFISIDKLSAFISKIDKNKTFFIQVLCGDLNTSKIQSILDLLTAELPLANITDASTAGEICNGVVSRKGILISFSLFENVK